MAQFLGRRTDKFDSPGMRGLAANWLPYWGIGSIGGGEGAGYGYWDIGPDGRPIARTYDQGQGEGSGPSVVPFGGGGGEGVMPWTQDLNALVAQAQQSGALTPQQFVSIFNQNAYQPNAVLNPDGTISYDAYSFDDEEGFLDRFMHSPTAPVAMFTALMGGVGGFGDLASSSGGGSGSSFVGDIPTAFDVGGTSIYGGPAPIGEGLLIDPATGNYILPPTTPGGPATFVPEGALIDPATGMPILPGANGTPIFPGQPGYPFVPNLPSTGVPMPSGGTPGAPSPSLPRAPTLPGTSGSTAGTVPKTDLQKIKDTLSISSAVGSLLSGLSTPNQGELSRLSRASDATRRQVINQNLGQIEASFADFDDKYFNSIADAFRQYYQPQVDDTFKRAAEQTIYAAPGGVGSTAFASKLGEVERDRSLASVAVGEQAADEAMRARSNIEGTKSSLIGLAESSEDPGAFGAQAVAAARASAQTPSYNPLADLFSRYANLAVSAGQAQRGGFGGGSANMARPTSFAGSDGGSRSSVKTVWA